MLAKKPKGATAKRQSSSASGLLWMFVGAVLTLMIGVFLYLSPLFDFTPAKTSTQTDRQVQPRVNTNANEDDYEFYDILPNQEMATIPDENILEPSQTPTNTAFEPDVVVVQPKSDTASNDGASSDNQSGSDDSNRPSDSAVSGNDDIVIIEENSTYESTPNSSNSSNTGSQDAPPTAQNQSRSASASVQRSAPATTYILQINSFGSADEADRRRAQVLMAGVDAKVVKNNTANGAPIYQVISRPMDNRKAVSGAQQRLQNNGIDSIIVEQRR